MLEFIKNHPYLTAWIIVFVLLFAVGIFAIDFSWTESLFGSAVLSTVGVISYWWKYQVWP